MRSSLYDFFSSIKLTLFLLTSSVLLIFFGTLDQVQFGIFFAQQKYFEHVLVVWQYPLQWVGGSSLQWFYLPLPGGYLLGPMLIINLAFAHFRYFRPSLRKIGIPFIHAGIVLLLVGQLWTQLRQQEYFLWIGEGERQDFVESFNHDEFVLIDRSPSDADTVYSWDTGIIEKAGAELQHPDLPFTVEVLWFSRNAAIFPRSQAGPDQFPQMPFDRGIGADQDLVALAQRPTFADGERNATSAIVRLSEGQTPVGTWLVSNIFRQSLPMQTPFPRQTFTYGGKTWEIALRFKRAYLPAEIELLEFRHDRYPGTQIPFNFSSDVRIHEPGTIQGREALIYMNHPLRYAGLTFYQASFADNDTKSMFQVVRNPARWVPYTASAVTTAGLLLQFIVSLYLHGRNRRNPT